MRATAATDALDHEADIAKVQEWVSQANISTTRITDAVGGTSPESHLAALERLAQAGAKPTTWNSVHCELQRDWNRTKTVPGFVQIFIEHGRAGWFFKLVTDREKNKNQ